MSRMGKDTFVRVRLTGGDGSYILAAVLTTTQRDALTAEEGMIIFNSTTDQLEEYDGSTWQAAGQVIMTTHEALFSAVHGKDVAVKESDQILNDSATLQNDDDLLVPVLANEDCHLLLMVRAKSPSVTELKQAFSIPSGGALVIADKFDISTFRNRLDATATTDLTSMVSTSREYWGWLTYIGGSIAGNIQFQWAQGTATAEDTTVTAGSFLKKIRLV